MSARDRVLFGFLLVDAMILALIELFFLPVYIGQVQFPVTALLAAATTPLLVAVAGRLSRNRAVALAPLLVWFATLLLVGSWGPGGDLVMLADWRAFFLIGGGAFPSAIMLGIVSARNAASPV